MKQIKVHVVGSKFLNDADWIDGAVLEPELIDADLVVFTGGADVSPGFYDEPRNPKTYCNPQRDYNELAAFETAVAHGIPMVGICRGAQLTCALSGGRLIQHQENRFARHPILTIDGSEYEITSCHHQAMYPYDMSKDDYKIMAWTEDPYRSRMHENGLCVEISDKPFKEVEIAYFPKTRALGIQGHPEWMGRSKQDKRTIEYCNELVNNLLNKKL